MKKGFIVIFVLALMLSVTTMNALAHGGHSSKSGHKATSKSGVCIYQGCVEIGRHTHTGNYYCLNHGETEAYRHCTVKSCKVIGLHEHDGVYYHTKILSYGHHKGK